MVFIIYWCRFLSGEIKISWEHSEYKWLTLEEAIKDSELGFYNARFEMVRKLKEHIPDNFKLIQES